MTRGLSTNQFNTATGTIQYVRKQFNQRFIGGRIHGRCRHFDFEFAAVNAADFIGGGAGLKPDEQQRATGVRPKKISVFAH